MSEIWRPSPARVAAANLTRFIESVNARKGLKLRDYDHLYAWSVEQLADFWTELARFAEVRIDWGTGAPITDEAGQASLQMPGARFFRDSRLNFAENLLRHNDDQQAIIFRNERATRSVLSHKELRDAVARIADGLRAAGVVAGDRVAAYMPNLPETMIAMLATASIGALWSSCSPDFGVHGIVDRFGQIAPKVLFTADGYFYAGKTLDSLGPMAEVLKHLPSVERVVVIPYVNASPDLTRLRAAVAASIHAAAPEASQHAAASSHASALAASPHAAASAHMTAPAASPHAAASAHITAPAASPHAAASGHASAQASSEGAAASGRATASAAPAQVVRWDEFGTPGRPLQFASLPFNHPLYILYSSGTTGVPKCIVHGAGGTLLQHQKEHLLHTDVRRGDRLFYFTTCGWMMWNWLASGLATGATLILFDGSPFHPGPGALWNIAAEEGITIFGTSAKYLAAMEKSDFVPVDSVNLSALRTVLSTGSPLLPDGFDYVYRSVKSDVLLASISGGTDIVSCFALGCPIRPVHRGELQCRGLGMKVDIFDDDGRSLQSAHERGELVCTTPFPSMPVGFWNDPEGRKYRAAYFERFPGIWHHGDYAALTENDGIIIYGRSDAVLNPGGVRIGTAEIYSAVEGLAEVLESLAVGQDWQNDVRVVLFVRLKPGCDLDEPLRKRIRDTIRSNTSPRHVPAKVIAVADLPRTLSGKLTELAVRNVIHGLPVKNVDALANPQALEHFRDLPDLTT